MSQSIKDIYTLLSQQSAYIWLYTEEACWLSINQLSYLRQYYVPQEYTYEITAENNKGRHSKAF